MSAHKPRPHGIVTKVQSLPTVAIPTLEIAVHDWRARKPPRPTRMRLRTPAATVVIVCRCRCRGRHRRSSILTRMRVKGRLRGCKGPRPEEEREHGGCKAHGLARRRERHTGCIQAHKKKGSTSREVRSGVGGGPVVVNAVPMWALPRPWAQRSSWKPSASSRHCCRWYLMLRLRSALGRR